MLLNQAFLLGDLRANYGCPLLVGQGNFVATLCRARRDDTPCAQADLYRIEDGFIVEHWDAAEPIGPESEWANSGKF